MPTDDEDLVKLVNALNERRAEVRGQLIAEREELRARVGHLDDAIARLAEPEDRPALASTNPLRPRERRLSERFADSVYQLMMASPGHTTTVSDVATMLMPALPHPRPKEASLRARVYKALADNPTLFCKGSTYGKWVAVPRRE